MPDIVIKAVNVSKKYRLGVLNSGSLKQDINAAWGKAFSRQGQLPDEQHTSSSHIWALKNINFEISRGESLGFVGKNGAGKSTLFKILSRVTLPTVGSIKGIGRIASLLEVGTGFHPELTGRENIFLNGHILGMKKKEIIKKFDEIVDFSGVEQFIDTPVKRYSSGMYVRLSFAVAAHLDADILLVDEALAVGDAEFQAKCIGKMKDISSKEGKTVIFVSHNMQAVRTLCRRAIYLDKGTIIDDGPPEKVIANYLKKGSVQYLSQQYDRPEAAPGNQFIRIKKAEIVPLRSDNNIIDTSTPLQFHFEFWQFTAPSDELMTGIHVYDFSGTCLFDLRSPAHRFSRQHICCTGTIPGGFLNPGSYYISIDFIRNNNERMYFFEACLSFDVQKNKNEDSSFSQWAGLLQPGFPVLLTEAAPPADN